MVDVRFHAITINTCETASGAVAITIFPGTRSGFLSTNYSPFNDNCSPQTIDFSVDAETQSLNAYRNIVGVSVIRLAFSMKSVPEQHQIFPMVL
ncbi:MAG: hypothetical protein U5K54_18090 [Cytophagales bacterium]|nr:hypothetical protein [Cytophagales bacterium]